MALHILREKCLLKKNSDISAAIPSEGKLHKNLFDLIKILSPSFFSEFHCSKKLYSECKVKEID